MLSAAARLLQLLCLFCVLSTLSLAQQSSSALNGVVLDPFSAAIASASISVTDLNRGVSKTIMTDAQGRFSVPDVASGSTAFDATSSSVDSVITSHQIKNLPLNGRNYLELAFLAPSNTPAPTFDPTKNHTVLISSAGQVGRGSTVMVDGADNSDDVVGGSLVKIPQDAVSEFQMATNRFSAALGRSGSSVTNVVTKQGTNELHGNVSFFERDKALGAAPDNFSAPDSSTPPFHRQQYAASIGGPIVRDKAWWFVGVEDRQQLGGFLVDTRDLATQSVTRSFVQQPLHDWLSTARVDWQPLAHDRFTVRESLELEDDQSGSAPDRAVSSATQQQRANNHLQSISSEWAHTFSTTLLNQFRFSDNNFVNKIAPTENLPQISFPSIVDGASFRVPQSTRQFRLQFGDMVTWNRGAHNFAFGADAQVVDADFFLGVFQQGLIQAVEDFPDFDPNGDGKVDDNDVLFAVGVISGHANQPVVIPDADNTYYALFAQDDWRATRKLTLNFGLRYEADTDSNNKSRVSEINPIVQPFLKGTRRSLNNNWRPRVGFAYSPDDKTVLRGGYGVYYDRSVLEVESLERGLDGRTLPINAHLGNLAFLLPNGIFAPGAPTLGNAFSGPVIPGAGASGIDIIDNRARNPMVQQFNLGIERDFGAKTTLRLDGVHNLGTHFLFGRKIGTVFNPVAGGPDTVNNIESSVNTHYDALLVSAKRQFGNGAQLNVAYTLSKAFN